MKTYNLSKDFFEMPFYGVAGTGDDDDATSFFMSLDMNDDETRRRVIAKFIVPYCKTYADETLDLIKVAMGYLIDKGDYEFLERGFDSCLAAIGFPDEIPKFFVEVWEAIFSQPFHFDEDVEVIFNRPLA